MCQMINLNDLIHDLNFFNYKELFTSNRDTNIFLIKNDRKNIIYKKVFDLCLKRYNQIIYLNKILVYNDFYTPKILDSKLDKKSNVGYFLYEFIEKDREFLRNKRDFEKLADGVINFYDLTKNFKSDIIFKPFKDDLYLKFENINSYYKKLYLKVVKNIEKNKDKRRFIFRDLHKKNLIISKEKFYFLDLDDCKVGNIEFDLANIFISFGFNKFDLSYLKMYSFFLNKIKKKVEVNLELLVDFIIYVLMIYYNKSKKTLIDKKLILTKINWVVRNREKLIKIFSL